MGATIDAWIEYDAVGLEPFSVPPEVLPLNQWNDLRHAKDYRVFGALSGIRNSVGIEPLFPLRGIPPNPSCDVTEWVGNDGAMVGWLHPSEVRLALAHHHVSASELSLEMCCVLNLLEFFLAKIGDARVRLVFEIE